MKVAATVLGLCLAASAMAQDSFVSIACKNKDGFDAVLTAKTCAFKSVTTKKMVSYPCYSLAVDEEMSSNLVGRIGVGDGATEMDLSLTKRESMEKGRDILDCWDGNAGATVELPKGAATGSIAAGRTFPGLLIVRYIDVATDEVTNKLKCKVIE